MGKIRPLVDQVLELTSRDQCPWKHEEEVRYSEYTVDYDVFCKLKPGHRESCDDKCPLKGKALIISANWE